MEKNQRVLIVDDEARNQRIMSEILEDKVDLRIVSSGEEALSVVEEYRPDLVLLDIMMPGINGYEVCQKIKNNPNLHFTKVILVSGKAMIEERIKGYDEGADDYMTKPFVPEELLAKAKVFLRLTLVEKELTEFNQGLDEKVQEKTKQLFEAEGKMITSAKMSALGEMAGGIAHEINTPLGAIGLIADQLGEVIHEEPLDKKFLQDQIKTIGDIVHRIGVIIHSLRTFSRDGSKDRFESVPAKAIIDGTLRLCKERLKNNGIEFQLGDIANDLKVRCQEIPISQVLLNLIGNSCDAISAQEKKWIKLTTAEKDGQILFVIEDSGKGIPAEIREKIFQPFFTTKDIGKGTGLGLSISSGIAKAHGGELRLDDQSSHTKFILQLPKG